MININELKKIWNSNLYNYNPLINIITIRSIKNNKFHKKLIVICTNDKYNELKEIGDNDFKIKKNCLVRKNFSKINTSLYIYLTENYILSILRTRCLNKLLND